MSKRYKKRKIEIEQEEPKEGELSKKELYDLKKKEKEKEKKKTEKKKSKKREKNKKTYQTSLVGRIFAIIMLILMIGSVIATISYSFR